VDELAEAHSGEAFADAVRRYAGSLAEEEREELKAVLLERARLLEDAVEERFKVRGWFARTLERVEDAERRLSPPDNQSRR
jgi:hypothetical protein